MMIRYTHQVVGYRLEVTVAQFFLSPVTCYLSPKLAEGKSYE